MITDASPSTLAAGRLRPDEVEHLSAVFRALGDPTRLRLLSLIAAADGGEACICDLVGPVGLSQPTVSHHMKLLVDTGLVAREKRGRWAFYRLVDGRLVYSDRQSKIVRETPIAQ